MGLIIRRAGNHMKRVTCLRSKQLGYETGYIWDREGKIEQGKQGHMV